jgi:hypothetical protein
MAEYECQHCRGKFRITIPEESEKGMEPLIEFCLFCGVSSLYQKETE